MLEPIREIEIKTVHPTNLSEIEDECLIEAFEFFVKKMLKISFKKIEFDLKDYPCQMDKSIQNFSLNLKLKRKNNRRYWLASFKNSDKQLHIKGIVKYGVYGIHR